MFWYSSNSRIIVIITSYRFIIWLLICSSDCNCDERAYEWLYRFRSHSHCYNSSFLVRPVVKTGASKSLFFVLYWKELNKRLLAAEQDKKQYQSDIQSIKQLLCQEMRIPYNENVLSFCTSNKQMSISELKARFRGFRRREEELEEAKLVEHNRNVSELFASFFSL